MPVLLELGAIGRRASVLPDNGVVNGFAGLSIPDQCGFALIGDADGRHIASRDPGLAQRRLDRPDHAFPDFLGIMFYPAILGENLGELLLTHPGNAAILREYHRPARGGALIDRQNILGHARLLRLLWPSPARGK